MRCAPSIPSVPPLTKPDSRASTAVFIIARRTSKGATSGGASQSACTRSFPRRRRADGDLQPPASQCLQRFLEREPLRRSRRFGEQTFIACDGELEGYRILFVVGETGGVVGERRARELIGGKTLRNLEPPVDALAQVWLRERPEVPCASIRGINLLRSSGKLLDRVGASAREPVGVRQDDQGLGIAWWRAVGNDTLVEWYHDFGHVAERVCDDFELLGRGTLGQGFEVIEQHADVAGALVRFDDRFEFDGWIVERHNGRMGGYGGETRALWPGWNVDVGHEVRSLGCPGGEPRVAPNGTSGDTLGVRRHDRDVVPPASTSVTFGRAWSSRVERSSPGVESRAVA